MKNILGPHWWMACTVLFSITVVITLCITPLCKRLAVKMDVVDRPKVEAHKGHSKVTPLFGGLAMCLSWVIILLGAYAFIRYCPQEYIPQKIEEAAQSIIQSQAHIPMLVIMLCGAAIMLIGLYDDIRPLKAYQKLIGQLLVACAVMFFGDVVIQLPGSLSVLNYPVTLFWFVLLFNAINFFDNMDGLAAGTAAIALSLFTACALIAGQYFVAAMAACTAGTALGFWLFNYAPASIFMGDSGSHFLAFMLGVISVKITYITPDARTYLAPLIPIFILSVPLYDVAAVVVIRLHKKLPIYKGDHNHISHRFVNMGMTRPQAVFAVHLLSLTVGLSVLPLFWGNLLTTVIAIVQALAILGLISLLQYVAKQREC